MKETLSQILLVGLLWIGVVVDGTAEPARVAIAGDPSLANLIAMTESELSKQSELTVLDRADLNKLGQEAEIQAALASEDMSRMQVLPADGLVLLRSAGAQGKTGVFARLVAVQPGIVLREVALPDGADPAAQVQALQKEFAAYWPKLAVIREKKVEGLSLLGLRCEVDAPGARELERRTNLLLASCLSAAPNVVILERWRLHDAVFEKSITREEPAPFWSGGSLIDGSLRLRDGLIEATLRLRPPQGPEVSFSDKDTPENLPAMVERLADKIVKQPVEKDGWKLSSEAAHYAQLGAWCLDNRLYEEGGQALETALALGDTSRTTHMLQVKAYAMQAYPDDLRVFNTSYQSQIIKITRDSLPHRLEAAARAALLAREYLQANRDFASPKWTPEDPADLGLPVLNNCLRTLRAAYENGLQKDDAPQMAEARHEVQKLITQLEEYLPGKSSSKKRYFLLYQIRYASLWHDTPDETLAFYRKILADKTEEGDVREELFHDLVTPYLDGEGTPVFISGIAQSNAPWIVGWDGQSDEELKAIWQKFVQNYAATSDPVELADALKFEYFSEHTMESRDRTLAKIVTLLKQHPETIQGPRGTAFVTGFSESYAWARQKSENAACLADLLELYRTLFSQQAPLPANWIFDLATIPDQKQPATEVLKGLLAALNDYAQWYQKQTPQDYHCTEALARARQAIARMRPELVAPAPTEGTLAVHQLWLGRGGTQNPDQSINLPVDGRTVTIFENKIWFLKVDYPHKVVCLDPATLQIVSTYSIPDQFDPSHIGPEPPQRALEVTDKWLIVAVAGQVLLCSRSDQQWHALEVPPSSYKPYWVNRELYLLYNTERGDRLTMKNANDTSLAGSGLIRVALPEGKIDNLISSRRVPPQSALDGKPLGKPTALWMGQTGLTMALDSVQPTFQVYASPVGKNDWRSAASDRLPCRVKLTADGAVIGHRLNQLTFTQITLMNKKGNQVLLTNPAQTDPAEKGKPLWNFPDELRTTPAGQRSDFSPMMRQGDLCLCRSTLGDAGEPESTCLYYFTKGGGDGLKIPLSFDVAQIKNAVQARLAGRPSLTFQGLAATDYGLILCGSQMQGFWVIPWADIDAYRAKAKPGP